MLRAVAISSLNLGAGLLVTPTVLDWSLGLNASAVSLATAESPPTSWAPRRIPLGLQAFKVGDLAGQAANDVKRDFDSPLVIDAGRFLHIILQIPYGTATLNQIIRGDVMISGVFE